MEEEQGAVGGDRRQVRRRGDQFTERVATRIWQEIPSRDNPYLAESVRCHGYELTELMRRCSFSQVLFLLFRGELPQPHEAQLLERLQIGLINPGPRHPATRAAMNGGVGKSDPAHLLPLALMVLGGDHLGAGEVEPAMRFLRRSSSGPAAEVIASIPDSAGGADLHPVPGFGRRYGGIDPLPRRLAEELATLAGAGSVLAWGNQLVGHLEGRGIGWLTTGVAAAAFCDLGFMPRAAAGLFQLLCAPGLLAHGVELANKPVTAFPWISDENYIIEDGQH